MNFSFEECELINGLYEEIKISSDKEGFITKLSDLKDNSEDPELLSIVENVLSKLKLFDNTRFNNLVSNLPISNYLIY